VKVRRERCVTRDESAREADVGFTLELAVEHEVEGVVGLNFVVREGEATLKLLLVPPVSRPRTHNRQWVNVGQNQGSNSIHSPQNLEDRR
jgi:hypothetical protein